MPKAIVTGGAGFIGSHIVEALLADGLEVEVIDNLSSGYRENLPKGVVLHELDIRSPEVRELLLSRKPDFLVHCAAQISVRVSMEDPCLDTDINVRGIVNLLQAFKGTAHPHFVFLSTGGAIYGEQEVFPAPENHPVVPCSIYGLAKRVGELYLDLWKRQFGAKFVALRLANVYGPRQNPHGEAGVVAIFNQRLLNREVPTINGSGKQTRDFVFVKDVARAVAICCRNSSEGIFNIGTGRETDVNRLYELIRGALGSSLDANRVPAKAGEQMRSSIDSGLAKRALGWEPQVGIEEGIRKTCEWFESEAGKAAR